MRSSLSELLEQSAEPGPQRWRNRDVGLAQMYKH
ncbi:MAG: hypothetical protein ACI8RC_001129, partial [Ilumatobacter sp.]